MIGKITNVAMQRMRPSLRYSSIVTCIMFKSRILRGFDRTVLKRVVHAVMHVAGLATKPELNVDSRRRFSHRIICLVRNTNPPLFRGIDQSAFAWSIIPVTGYARKGPCLFSLHSKKGAGHELQLSQRSLPVDHKRMENSRSLL